MGGIDSIFALPKNSKIEDFYNSSIEARMSGDIDFYLSFFTRASAGKIRTEIEKKNMSVGEMFKIEYRNLPEKILGTVDMNPFYMILLEKELASGRKVLKKVFIHKDRDGNLEIANFSNEDFFDDFVDKYLSVSSPEVTKNLIKAYLPNDI